MLFSFQSLIIVRMYDQAAHAIIMVKPVAFGYNRQTAKSNVFQEKIKDKDLNEKAQQEFDSVVKVLKKNKVPIKVFDDLKTPETPDAIFPNNWFFTLPEGQVVVCPMESPIRRDERRQDIIDHLKKKYSVSEVIDLTVYEDKNKYLEGTGSIVFDHVHRKAYTTYSSRTDESLFNSLCQQIEYKPVAFMSRDDKGDPIYHTNVMLSIGTGYAIVCLDAVHPADHEVVLESLFEDDMKVISISYDQMLMMTANSLEIKGEENVLVMAEKAFENLLPGQLNALTELVEVITVNIPTIEKVGGGGVRCMMAGIHLPQSAKRKR